MLVGVYGDCHITKNMRAMQSIWETTATKSIYHMYDKFDEMNVELAICLGDFFDAPKLEAKHLNFVLPILDEINRKTYPTYILLGNHEADSDSANILEYLSIYDNIHPVTSTTMIENLLFIPYYEDPTTKDTEDKIVFTHHDIYGSALASGKTSAFFGLNPRVFCDAKLVMNGHVHLKSKVTHNIVNAGSLLVSQHGELRLGDHPSYYLLDTHSATYQVVDNKHSMIYLTIDESQGGEIVKNYDQMHTVLKVEYADEIPDVFINTAHTSWHKKISSIESSSTEVVHHNAFDMKNYLVNYIKNDKDVSDSKKSDYVNTGLEMLT